MKIIIKNIIQARENKTKKIRRNEDREKEEVEQETMKE